MDNKHNIFEFATSELSNDAVLCWIVNGYKNLSASVEFKKVSNNLISLLLGVGTVEFDEVIIKRQHGIKNAAGKKFYIDIYVELMRNNEVIHKIIIEDKVNAVESGNQLTDYLGLFNDNKISTTFAYVVIGNRSNRYKKSISGKGWKVIDRNQLLGCLKFNKSDFNPDEGLLLQYLEYLSNLESEFAEFAELEVKDWNHSNIQGFFQSLEDDKTDYDWAFVNNQNGGFWAMWFMKHTFRFRKQADFAIYLQLEYPNRDDKDMRITIKFASDNYDDFKNRKSEEQLYLLTDEFREKLINNVNSQFFTLSRKTNARTMTLAYRTIIEEKENPNLKEIKQRINDAIKVYDELVRRIDLDKVYMEKYN